MNKIYFFALLVAVTSANLAVDSSNIVPSQEILNCLAKESVSKVIFDISGRTGVLSAYFLDSYIFARDAGIATVDGIVVVNDNLSVSELSANVVSALPRSFNGIIWLQIYDSPSLWSEDVSKRISYLESLVLAFKQRGVKAGVSSNEKTWISVFGSQGAGSDTLKAAPVWYVNDNGNQSFDDFSYAGFGTWTQPALKNYQKDVWICDISLASFNYYDANAEVNNNRRFLN